MAYWTLVGRSPFTHLYFGPIWHEIGGKLKRSKMISSIIWGWPKLKGANCVRCTKFKGIRYIPTCRSLVGEKPHDSRYLSSITKITLCDREPSWPCPHRSKTPLRASNIRNFLSLQLVTICVPNDNNRKGLLCPNIQISWHVFSCM